MGIQSGLPEYYEYIKAAVLSAHRNAPSLLPVLLFEGAPSNFTAWYEAHGKSGSFFIPWGYFPPMNERGGGELVSVKRFLAARFSLCKHKIFLTLSHTFSLSLSFLFSFVLPPPHLFFLY